MRSCGGHSSVVNDMQLNGAWKSLVSFPGHEAPGNETRRSHSSTKICTYQAPANSISSWEYLPSSGSLGGGPFTTTFSCSKIVVHFPWGKVPSLISPCLTELLQGCGICACLMFLCGTHTCMYNVPAQGKVINPFMDTIASNISRNLIGCVNRVASATTLPNRVRYAESLNEWARLRVREGSWLDRVLSIVSSSSNIRLSVAS